VSAATRHFSRQVGEQLCLRNGFSLQNLRFTTATAASSPRTGPLGWTSPNTAGRLLAEPEIYEIVAMLRHYKEQGVVRDKGHSAYLVCLTRNVKA